MPPELLYPAAFLFVVFREMLAIDLHLINIQQVFTDQLYFLVIVGNFNVNV